MKKKTRTRRERFNHVMRRHLTGKSKPWPCHCPADREQNRSYYEVLFYKFGEINNVKSDSRRLP